MLSVPYLESCRIELFGTNSTLMTTFYTELQELHFIYLNRSLYFQNPRRTCRCIVETPYFGIYIREWIDTRCVCV